MFLQRWGGDGRKWLRLDREEPRCLPNHNTHYEVFTNGQMYSQSALSTASHVSRTAHKCGDRRIDEVRHWADILITCNMVPCIQSPLTSSASVENWEMDQLRVCWTWKSGLEQKKKGQRQNPPTGNQHPHSADFQTNIMITIFWPFGVCCFRLWQYRQKKPEKMVQYGLKSLFWPHNLFS